jgi:hypothetical protein
MARMLLGHRSLTLPSLLLGLALAVGLLVPAHAEEPMASTLTLTGEPTYADRSTPLRIALVREDGSPVAGGQVTVERRTDGTWTQAAVVATDEKGQGTLDVTLARDRADNRFRASWAGDATATGSESGEVPVALERRTSTVRVSGPDEVVDERTVQVHVRWVAGRDVPVRGTVRLMRRNAGGDWKLADRLSTDDEGRASLTVRPREDTRWKAVVRRLDWVTADTSGVHRVDNLPPGTPVDLPAAAPKPRINLPDQPHAVGTGAHPVVRAIPDGIWRQMTGRTWHSGCPVGRPALRLLRINYWDYRGYRRRGELVAHADAVHQMSAALADMYAARLPVRAMYRVDRFGWSSRLRGGDDYRSMAAGNTSAFNCRQVVGSPGSRSPHAYGRSLDLNTWENPYRSRQGTVPNTWWMGHSHARVAWRSREHRVVEIMARHGLRWTYGNGDTQHFDVAPGSGRVSTSYLSTFEECGGVCD